MQCLLAVMNKAVLKGHGLYEENRSLKHHLKEGSRRSVSLHLLLCMLCKKISQVWSTYATLQGHQQQWFHFLVDFWWT